MKEKLLLLKWRCGLAIAKRKQKEDMDYLITGQERNCLEKRMAHPLLEELLELDKKIDHVIELVTESGLV